MDPKGRIRLHIVIVNYRTSELVENCLRSLAEERGGSVPFRVTVVDNASGDGSAESLQECVRSEAWGDWISLVPLNENRGFAGGNNVVIGPVLDEPDPPDYILLLNPDTQIRAHAVEELVRFMDEHPHTGIAGSRLEDPDETPQRSAFRFPSLMSEVESAIRSRPASGLLSRWVVAPPQRDEVYETDWVAGASMIVRREVFSDVGLMDDAYFLYFEEVDFCLASHRAGWRCHYVPSSRVVHLVGQASGVTCPGSKRRRPAYWFESRQHYFRKNHGALYAALADLLWIAGHCVWRLRRFLERVPPGDPPHYFADFVRHSLRRRRRGAPVQAVRRSPQPGRGWVPHPDGLIAQLREDWIAHDRDWTRPGFRALAAHRFGNWRLAIERKPLRAPLSVLYLRLFRRVRNHYGIELPWNARIGRRVVFEHQGAIVVHGSSVIGDDCIVRHGVTLGIRSVSELDAAPTLGRHVNVGAGAKILGAVKLGDGVNVGANAVVLKDVPAGATAVGIPAVIVPPEIPWQDAEDEEA